MGFASILCPIDFSETSRFAMLAAIDLCRASAGNLTLLHVWSFPPSLVAAPEAPIWPSLTDDLAREAERLMAAWRRDAEEHGASQPATLVTGGVPWNSIVEEAKRVPYDLIVLGSHGRTGLKHAFLGSVAERVVRHATCPVLVVRARH